MSREDDFDDVMDSPDEMDAGQDDSAEVLIDETAESPGEEPEEIDILIETDETEISAPPVAATKPAKKKKTASKPKAKKKKAAKPAPKPVPKKKKVAKKKVATKKVAPKKVATKKIAKKKVKPAPKKKARKKR